MEGGASVGMAWDVWGRRRGKYCAPLRASLGSFSRPTSFALREDEGSQNTPSPSISEVSGLLVFGLAGVSWRTVLPLSHDPATPHLLLLSPRMR